MGRLSKILRNCLAPTRHRLRQARTRNRSANRVHVEMLEGRRLLTSFLVSSTGDAGAGSLRQAILDANAAAGPDEIVFAIPGAGPHTIQPLSALPEVVDAATIDGYTQPGASVNTLDAGTSAVLQIELDGSLAGADVHGLVFRNASSVVRGLAVNRFDGAGIAVWDVDDGGRSVIEGNFLGTDITGEFPRGNRSDGVRLEAIWVGGATVGGAAPAARNIISASTGDNYLGQNGSVGNGVYTAQAANVVIAGNLIGTDRTGTQSLANAGNGIHVTFSDGTRIGGTGAGEGNLISGNVQYGVALAQATGTLIQGNRIGTDVFGSQALANSTGMLIAHSSGTIVGGTSAGAGNLISGNSGVGIGLSLATDSIVQGNRIGTDHSGMHSLANGGGIGVSDASSRNLFGGSTPEAANLISGNSAHGILLNGPGVTGNRIQGNRIGADATGNGGLGNEVTGIAIIAGASGNLVGGTDPESGNVVAYNQVIGVYVHEGAANAILGNSIHDNEEFLGISFPWPSPTANDLLDADSGPNGLQNFPLLSSVTATHVSGSLNSLPSSRFRLEFFANTLADPSGYGEGERFVGSFEVTTDAAGDASFTAPMAALFPSELFVSATATRLEFSGGEWSPTDTSEFSPVLSVAPVTDTRVALDPSGNLQVTDEKLGGKDDLLTLSRVTIEAVSYVRVLDPNQMVTAGDGSVQIDPHTVDTPLSAITGEILVDTLDGDDLLAIDFAGGNPIPAGGIQYAGGSGGQDALTLASGTTTSVAHVFTNSNDGSLTLAGDLAGAIVYTGLEPVTDNLNATDRTFTFNGGSETITLVDAVGANLTIDSTAGESVTFANPTGSLTINGGSGDDTITISSVDAVFDASLAINGDQGNDQVTVNAAANLATDRNLDLDLTDDAAAGDSDSIQFGSSAHWQLAGSGAATAKASRGISSASGTVIGAVDGDLVFEANRGQMTPGDFLGLHLTGTTLHTTGQGSIRLEGTGGALPTTSWISGVRLADGTSVSATGAGAVTIVGTGGNGASGNRGVMLKASSVSTAAGDLSINGTGRGSADYNLGVELQYNSRVAAGGGGGLMIHGQGGNGSDNGRGVSIHSSTVEITSGAGQMRISGTAAGSDNWNSGVLIYTNSRIVGGASPLVIEGQGSLGSVAGTGSHGVTIASDSLVTSAGGEISVTGTGGGTGMSGANRGVQVDSGGRIVGGGLGNVHVTGTGGGGSGSHSLGVLVTGAGSTITSQGGDVTIDGTGGAAGGLYNHGVRFASAAVASGGALTIHGVGGTGSEGCVGVTFENSTVGPTGAGGELRISGVAIATGRWNHGIQIYNNSHVIGGVRPLIVEGVGGNGSGGGEAGVFLQSGSELTSLGGDIIVRGTGGGTGASGWNRGVDVSSGARIVGVGPGNVQVTGSGGGGTGDASIGVLVTGAGSAITAGGGDVSVTGTGGGAGTSWGSIGVCIRDAGQVSAAGNGDLSVSGFGGASSGQDAHGVWLLDAGSGIATSNGGIVVHGRAGAGPNSTGVKLQSANSIVSGGLGEVHLTADSMDLSGGINGGSNLVSLAPATIGTAINLGGSDAVGVLGLTDAELDRITAGTLRVGGDDSGAITVTADVTRPASTDLELVSGGDVILSGGQVDTSGGTLLLDSGVSPAAVQPSQSGTDVTADTLSFGGNLEIKVDGTVVDTQYTQLKVVGIVDLTGAELKISGNYTPVTADRVLIVNNDGGDAVIGTFNGLAEGASVNLNGTPMAITYLGGDGNDVELIANTPPSAAAGGSYAVAEGSSIQLDASGTSDHQQSHTTLAYDWDLDYDGVTFDADVTGMQPIVSFSDNFAPRTIAVRVTDNGGLSDVATTTLEVLNVAPSITALNSNAPLCSGVVEGEVVTITAAFFDPGTLDTHSAVIEWGDGTMGTIVMNAGQTSLTAGHAYSSGGLYSVTVTLTDDDGGTTAQSTSTAVVGAGIVNRVWYVVGTPDDDRVHLQGYAQDQLRVHADFFPEADHRLYSTQAFDQVVAFLCGGDDHLTTAGNTDIVMYVHGGDGNDRLHLAGGAAVAVGGAGNDDLQGGSGRNILIGGAGSDTLRAGQSGDVLIDAATQLDHNVPALFALLAEWNSAGSLDDRVNTLIAALEIDDQEDGWDTLHGGAGHDLFFAELEDVLRGNEHQDRIVAR